MNYRGLKDSLSFIHKLEKLEINGLPLKDHRVLGTYDFTPFVSQELLFTHAEFFESRGGTIAGLRASRRRGLVEASLSGLFSVIVSAIGIIAIILSRKKVLLYAADTLSSKEKHHDFRLDRVYRYFDLKKMSFAECFHTTLSRRTIFNTFKRRRINVFFLESIDFFYRVKTFFFKENYLINQNQLNNLGVPISMAKYFASRYYRALSLAKWRIRGLKFIFSTLPVKIIFTVDYPSHYGAMLVAAKSRGIRTIAFQHGHFTKYHLGWLNPDSMLSGEIPVPDRLYVWSDYWKRELLKLGTYFREVSIQISGYGDASIKYLNKEGGIGGDAINIMIPYETSANSKEMLKFLSGLASKAKIRIIFKLRPDMTTDDQLRDYGFLGERSGLDIVAVSSIDEALRMADCVLGVYSTILYDSVLRGVPVGVLKTGNDFGAGLWMNNLADLIDSDSQIAVKQISELVQLSSEERAMRRDILMGDSDQIIFADILNNELSLLKLS